MLTRRGVFGASERSRTPGIQSRNLALFLLSYGSELETPALKLAMSESLLLGYLLHGCLLSLD